MAPNRRMNRPSLLAAVVVVAACSGGGRAPAPPAPEPAPVMAFEREQTADQQVAHVLSRLAFGARPGDADKVRAMGLDRWIDAQLHPEQVDDAAFERFLTDNYQTLTQTPAQLETKWPPPGVLANQIAARNRTAGGAAAPMGRADSARLRDAQQGVRLITTEVQGARVARAVASERQLLEVMTDFWLNHFSVYEAKGPRQRYMLADYEHRVIRPNALGKFRTLLGAVAKSEAMLFYLDNWESQADSTRPRLGAVGGRGGRGAGRGGAAQLPPQIRRGGLNENYGRELLELHTLGVDGGYTQQDVINAARALTGWTFRGPAQGGGFQFVPVMHDAGAKVLLGHKLAAGRGIEDGEEVLDIVARHPSTAKYIATKLARRLVSDTPPGALVTRAAATFTRTDGDLRETVRTIIMSPEFFAHAAYRSKVKTPFEVVVSAARALGAQPDTSARAAQIVGQLGQPIYGHQAPNGWPETGDQWMNTGAILTRINFGMVVAAGRLPGASPVGFKDADILQTAARDLQVDGVIAAILGGDASPDTRAILMTGENPLAKAADSTANAPMAPAGGRGGRGGRGGAPPAPAPGVARPFGQLPPLRGLPLIVGLALGSPEFQRR